MNKKMLCIVLSLCLILTMFSGIQVFASGAVTLNKTVFTVSEKGQATISGLTEEEIENGAWIGTAREGDRLENTYYETAVSDLPANYVWEFTAPTNLGKYEVRLMNSDDELIAKASYSVGSTTAKAGDIKLSKSEVKINEPMSVTVNGLTAEQIEEGAWLGIAGYMERVENTYHDTYISDLPTDNTYKFNAPSKFGKYEVRVFSDGSTENADALFGKAEFLVVSSKAQPGDIVLSKTSVRPEEKLSVTVKGLTPGEIEEGAWIGIAKSGERLENTLICTNISELPVNNTYEFTANYDPGIYEVRVFCSGSLQNEEYEYGMFGKAEFIVSGDAAPATDISAGYEGLSGWAAPEVNKAKDENLVTDKVMIDFPADITREEFCELAVLLYEKMTGEKAAPVAANPFSDTSNPEILKAYNLKIVGGVGEGKFAPDSKVTRQEISVMLLRTLQAVMPNTVVAAEFKTKFHDEKDIAPWALNAVKFMNANGVLNGSTLGDGTSYILPKGNTTREQAILLVLRVFNSFYKI